jgi:hypothetical protein
MAARSRSTRSWSKSPFRSNRALKLDFFEHLRALNGRRQAVELGEEVAEQADRLEAAVVLQKAAGQALQIAAAVPVGTGRCLWGPLLPARIDGRQVRLRLALDERVDLQVRVEIPVPGQEW